MSDRALRNRGSSRAGPGRFDPAAAAAGDARPALPRRAVAWVRVWLHAGRLNAELGRGVPPNRRCELALLADRITRPSSRRALARAIEAAVDRADRPPDPYGTRVAIQSAEVRECRRELMSLAARLDSDQPVDAQGVALASTLVRDGASPLYYQRASHSLYQSARMARFALESL